MLRAGVAVTARGHALRLPNLDHYRVERRSLIGLWAANLAGSSEHFQGSPALQLVFSPYSLEFQMGMMVAFTWQWLRFRRLPACFYMLLASGSLIVLYIAGCFVPEIGVYPNNNHLFRLAYFGLPAFFLVAAVVQLDVSSRFKAPGWAILTGDASYAIYLVHVIIMNTLYKSFARLDPHPHFLMALCAFVGIGVASVLGGIFFHVFVERRFITFFHRRSPFGRQSGMPAVKVAA